MAPTKRKRRSSKHRGNAAGVVESRGRTGRPLSEQERKTPQKKRGRGQRFDEPPTWRSAALRALFAASLFGFTLVLLFKQELKTALPMTGLVLAFYIPLGYGTDLMLYRWRAKKREKAREKAES